jgi:hypothetical protein
VSIARSIAALTTAALLAVAPAALAVGPPAHPGSDHPTRATHRGADDAAAPGPDASAGVKAKAYGRLCQGQSKKHVKGEKGTAFSRCVTALARAATGKASPKEACAGLSHKHFAGRHGTAYSRCVLGAQHLAGQPA